MTETKTFDQGKYIREDQPRFLDFLCAAIGTLWIIIALSLVTFFIFMAGSLPIKELLFMCLAFSILSAVSVISVFILAGGISFPIWMILKETNILNHKTAAGLGGLTGGIICVIILVRDAATMPYLQVVPITDLEKYIVVTLVTLISGICGWNGYRFAWNGRRRKKARKS